MSPSAFGTAYLLKTQRFVLSSLFASRCFCAYGMSVSGPSFFRSALLEKALRADASCSTYYQSSMPTTRRLSLLSSAIQAHPLPSPSPSPFSSPKPYSSETPTLHLKLACPSSCRTKNYSASPPIRHRHLRPKKRTIQEGNDEDLLQRRVEGMLRRRAGVDSRC